MMENDSGRLVALDTETTGMNNDDGGEHVEKGHRVIEIGAVEIMNRRLTGRKYHVFLNPEMQVSKEAEAVHHISDEFLADKKKFIEEMPGFVEFIRGSTVLIHNASFDTAFLNQEFSLAHASETMESVSKVVDTLAVAKEMFPGERVSLDALCTRFEVDRTERETEGHGALLDALLLAEVYLRMTGGQRELTFGDDAAGGAPGSRKRARKTGAHFKVIHPSEAELALHESILDYVARVGRCTPVFRKEPEPPAEGAEAAGKQ
jgi:DNA polymerase-3 subunit epsilon